MRIHRTVLCLSLLPLQACMEQNFVTFPEHFLPIELAPAIRIEPKQHDFGSPFVGCDLEKLFRIHNDGDADLVVHDLAFDAGSDELAMHVKDVLPVTIAPGEATSLSVSYLALDDADDFGQIVAFSNDPEEHRATADVRGAAKSLGPVVDVFEQPLQARTDILVVIDNSGSMDAEQLALTQNFQLFVDAVVSANADFRVAILTTDEPTFVGPMVTLVTPDPVGTFNQQALSVGIQGSGDERPMDMVAAATSPGGDAAEGGTFLRDDAMLAVIVVTDEPDEFSTVTPELLVDHLVAVKHGDPDLVRFHTIGGDVPVPACESASFASVPLDEAVALTGGLFESVCGNWGATLTAVAAGSVALADTFELSAEPYVPSLVITVDGVTVTTGWTYDEATRTVVFELGSIPPSESIVEIAYEPRGDCAGEAD